MDELGDEKYSERKWAIERTNQLTRSLDSNQLIYLMLVLPESMFKLEMLPTGHKGLELIHGIIQNSKKLIYEMILSITG